MRVERNAELQPYNTLALSARAAILVHAASEQDVLDAITLAKQESLPLLPIGGGSNVVVPRDVNAVILHVDIKGVTELARDGDSVVLRVAAGEVWHNFVEWCMSQRYYGLENLALIPGTVGAAPIQNIGAYGVELDAFVEVVNAIETCTGRHRTLSREECEFGYRDSIFKRGLKDKVIITSVELRLPLGGSPNASYPSLRDYLDRHALALDPESIFDAVVAIRRQRLPDPAELPNAGSFFKNPVEGQPRGAYLRTRFPALPAFSQPDGRMKLSAAWMIEHCGWKGAEREGVGVDENHALVLVNRGSNSGEALLALAEDIRESVKQTFGYLLEIEPRVLDV